jgi:hypothetical protein
MRKLTLLMCLVFVAAPAAAMAAKPSHPTTPANSNANGTTAKVSFVLHGTVSSYAAGSAIQITLTSANRDHSALTPKLALPLMLDSHTKVVLHKGAAVVNGDKVVVTVRAAKNASTSALSTTAALQVVDQG